MAANEQPKDLSDLRTAFLEGLGAKTGNSSINTIADRYLNTALHDIHVNPGNNFPWATRRAVLLTHATYTTGTVAIDISSDRTAVTGTSTAWATAVTGMGFNNARAGGKIRFDTTDVYEVSAVGSDTSITLATRYIGDEDLSGDTYTYFEDEYALATDFLRPVDLRLFSSDLNIPLIGQMDFRRRYVRNYRTAKPQVATMIQLPFGSSTTPVYRVVLHPAPDQIYMIPYNYVTSNLAVTSAGAEQAQLSNTTDEPIVPLRFRHAIVLHALYNWYRDRKDDTRSQEAKAEYAGIMSRIAGESQIGDDRPRLMPRSYLNRRGRRRRRYSSGTEFEDLRV